MPDGTADAASEEPGAGPAPAARSPRGVAIGLAAFALLVVTAASATVTVAAGRPGGSGPTTVAAPPAPAGAADGPGPAPSPLPGITLPPPPGGSLHGTVNGSTHGGDLRYFLLPLPDGAEPYGAPDGSTMSTDDLAKDYSDAGGLASVLDSYGFQEAVTRRYRTADGKTDVRSRLMRFSSDGNAQAFLQGATFSNTTPVDVAGDGAARGFVTKPAQPGYTGHLIGVSSVGDVEYEVTVYVKGDPDPSLLTDVMKRQHDRLTSGG